MADLKTNRPFEQRFLGGFDRSRLYQEVLKSKKRGLGGLRKRYAGLVLGASLAIGGMGLGIKGSNLLSGTGQGGGKASGETPVSQEISADLKLAQSIAREVTGGVAAAAEAVVATPEAMEREAGKAVTKTAEGLAVVTEEVKESFFRTEVPFGSMIYKEAKKNDLPPELLAAVVKQESRFIPTARSHRGAQGLMQIVPKTGRWMGATNLMDPAQNVRAGAKYLRYLTDRFDGDQKKILAAYNAGEGNVRRFGGIPPFRETQKYVAKVIAYQADFSDQVSGHVVEVAQLAAR